MLYVIVSSHSGAVKDLLDLWAFEKSERVLAMRC